MDAAKQAAREGASHGTVVVANEQTAGRGRLQRSWISPRDANIALSVILYPSLLHLPRLTMMAAVAVARAVERSTGLRPAIKWPNDVMLNGRKVCGILTDSELQGGAVKYAIIGIGLNVNLDPSQYEEIAATATSLYEEVGEKVSRTEVLQALLEELERAYNALQDGEAVSEEWRRRLETLGRQVCVTLTEGVEEGVAEDVDPDGCLLLRKGDGRLKRIVAGDVTLRR